MRERDGDEEEDQEGEEAEPATSTQSSQQVHTPQSTVYTHNSAATLEFNDRRRNYISSDFLELVAE